MVTWVHPQSFNQLTKIEYFFLLLLAGIFLWNAHFIFIQDLGYGATEEYYLKFGTLLSIESCTARF